MRKTVLLLLFVLGLAAGSLLVGQVRTRRAGETILSVQMHLSAMGVESDTYPSIRATLDFAHHTSHCERSYFDPAYPGSTYHLSAGALDSAQRLLQNANLEGLKDRYTVSRTDQPTSTTVIHTASRTFTVKDYGLEGAAPLPKLYRLVYKLEYSCLDRFPERGAHSVQVSSSPYPSRYLGGYESTRLPCALSAGESGHGHAPISYPTRCQRPH